MKANHGCGDDAFSWAVDGVRKKVWHKSHDQSSGFGDLWAVNDVIGCAIDTRAKTISFSKNGSFAPPYGVAFRNIKVTLPVKAAWTNTNYGAIFKPLFGGPTGALRYAPPAGYSSVYSGVYNSVHQLTFGYRLTIVPVFPSNTLSIPEMRDLFEEHCKQVDTRFSKTQDAYITRYLNHVGDSRGLSLGQLCETEWEQLLPGAADLVKFPKLERAAGGDLGPSSPLRERVALIQNLNGFLNKSLSMLNLSDLTKADTLASRVARCRHVLFSSLKLPMWEEVLTTSRGGQKFDLKLSRSKARRFR